ncbi:MAG: hypothetical protein V4633_13760 [Pseudomonadota bacterium]
MNLALMVLAAICVGCGADRSATFFAEDGVSITVELEHAHSTLAEYTRKLSLARGNRIIAVSDLSRDTGGYAAANLSRCSPDLYLLDSYGEFLLIDARVGTIREGRCQANPAYLGIFDGAGTKPWRFFSAQESEERELRMSGA